MDITAPVGVSVVQDARTLCRLKFFHQGEKLFRFSHGEPDLHPGGLFPDTGVMAAMAIMAIMAG